MAKHKTNNSLLGVIAIVAIFLMTYLALTFHPSVSTGAVATSTNNVGQAAEVLQGQLSASSCKIIVGETTIYDSSTLAVTLESGASTYYAGYTVSVLDVNSDGCKIDINGNADYLAIGQVQQLGPLYVTVTDVVLQ